MNLQFIATRKKGQPSSGRPLTFVMDELLESHSDTDLCAPRVRSIREALALIALAKS
jgi:hypothetical protein